MKTKKLAVQPISPAAAAALTAAPVERPFVPTNWEDAFADLSERMLRVVGHQQAKIQTLTAELADARADAAAVTAAAGRAHAELVERFDALVILVEKLTATVAAVPDSIIAAVAPQQTTANDLARVTQMVTALDETATAHAGTLATLTRHTTATDEAVATLTQRVDHAKEVFSGQGESIDRARAVLDGCVEVLNGHGVTLGEHLDAIESLRGVVAAGDAAAAVQVDRVADLGTSFQSIRSDLQAAVFALDAETAARAAAIAKVAADIDDLSATASGEDDALSDRITALDQRTAAHTGKLDTVAENVGAVENRVVELQRIAMEHVERIATDGDRIERVEDTLTGFVAKVKVIAAEIEVIDKAVRDGTASIAETAAETADLLRRVNVVLGEMPSAMMIDQDGELVRVARSGELTKLGKVVAHGRDGTNAADIVAVRLDGERMVLTRSDRTEFGCSITALTQPAPPAAATPAAPEVDPTTLGYLSKDPATRYVQVADMVTMRTAKKSYKAIAEKYKISERQVVRLIKGHKDEKPSHT